MMMILLQYFVVPRMKPTNHRMLLLLDPFSFSGRYHPKGEPTVLGRSSVVMMSGQVVPFVHIRPKHIDTGTLMVMVVTCWDYDWETNEPFGLLLLLVEKEQWNGSSFQCIIYIMYEYRHCRCGCRIVVAGVLL